MKRSIITAAVVSSVFMSAGLLLLMKIWVN